VYQALHKASSKLYAIKVINKKHVERLEKISEIKNERQILS
jgi:serine/threonine protein kinase